MRASSPLNAPEKEEPREIFYEHDFTSEEIRWHGAVLSLLGWSGEELPCTHHEWFRFIHPDDLPVFSTVLSGSSRGAFSARFRFRHKEGHYVYVHDHGVFYRDLHGSVTRRIGTLREAAALGGDGIAPGAPTDIIRDVLDSMFVFVIVLSCDGQILEVNNAPLEVAGIRRADVLGQNFLDTAWFAGLPETKAQVKNMLRCVSAGETVREDFQVRFDDELRVVDATFGPLRGESGQVTHIVGSSVDITSRKQAEETLRQLGRQHEMILNAAGEGICGVDRQGRATFVNWAAARMLGYTVEEMIGRQIPIEARLFDGKNRRAERGVFWRRDGTSFPVEYTSDQIYDDGEIVGGVVVFNDITARVEAEEARCESELRFRQVVENIRELFWITDLEDRELYMSPGFKDIWGASRDQFRAGPLGLLDTVHPEDRPRVEEALRRGTREEFDEEFRIVRADGSIRWLRSRVFPVKNDKGVLYRRAGLAEDITEAKRLNEQLRQSQKLEAVGQLASGVAHDFNNLLTIIQGNASLILGEAAEDSKVVAYAGDILQAAEQSAGLTRQLLLFSSRQAMQQRQLQINEVVADVARMLQRILGEDIALTTEYSPKLPLVYADAGMIEQILLNLAVNARDAMPRGGRLVISTRQALVGSHTAQHNPQLKEGAYVCISVSDTGHGIAPEILPRIFEPFFTTKEMGKGTGLGLATVYGIVKQHHGWVDVQSRPREGTTFYIWLPATKEEAPEPRRQTGELTLPRGTETVLVVEDEKALRLLASHILERCGYTVLTAQNGIEAVEIWKQHAGEIDLLLTDMVMPGNFTGRELAEHLTSEKPGLKVMFTSGYSTEIVGKDFTLLDGINFLQKPYQAATLARAIRDCLDDRPVNAS